MLTKLEKKEMTCEKASEKVAKMEKKRIRERTQVQAEESSSTSAQNKPSR